MTFRNRKRMLAKSLDNLIRTVGQLKDRLESFKVRSAAQDVTADQVLSLLTDLVNGRELLAAQSVDPGLIAYAKVQMDEPAYDINAEAINLLAELDILISDLIALIPKNGSGYLLKDKIVGNKVVARVFTTAQTLPLRNAINTLLLSID